MLPRSNALCLYSNIEIIFFCGNSELLLFAKYKIMKKLPKIHQNIHHKSADKLLFFMKSSTTQEFLEQYILPCRFKKAILNSCSHIQYSG